MQKNLHQQVLENGLHVIVAPKKDSPTVAVQLWYNVGSKHEKDGEKGLAHLLEHMIFKGTTTLTESDINLIASKLSGYCNAFTSYDYTGYVFDIPVANWEKILPIMADCMYNCTCKQDLLNSELKAVIQELKMYKDMYNRSLLEEMTSAIFVDHPYHYPIIGFKQDLWSMTRESLLAFYKQHYAANNACLVIVGDVDIEKTMQEVTRIFGVLPAGTPKREEEYYINKDLVGKSVRLVRDVQQAIGMVGYTVPGVKARKDYLLEVANLVLGSGKASRLYRKLVDQLQIATSVSSFVDDLFDESVLFIEFHPKHEKDIDHITQIIQEEIDAIAQHGITPIEEQRASKQAYAAYVDAMEETDRVAYLLGKYHTALKDAGYMYEYAKHHENIGKEVQELFKNYCRASVRHEGRVVSMQEQDKPFYKELQQRSDKEDERILQGKVRSSEVEEGLHVHTISVDEPTHFEFSKPEVSHLSNGLKVITCDKPHSLEKIEVVLECKTKSWYDPNGKEGLGVMLSSLLSEGTKKYPGHAFMEALESYGMSISIMPGSVYLTMLSDDAAKGFEFLQQVLMEASFDMQAFAKVHQKLLQKLKKFWDTPNSFVTQLARQNVYENHPYAKNALGTQQTLESITYEEVLHWYKTAWSPQEALIAIVGNFKGQPIFDMVQQALGNWQGGHIQDLLYPELYHGRGFKEVLYPMNRDQVVLGFANLSIPRLHEDYDNLLLFDEIFASSTLHSMSSKLFELREATGLFYTISGSLVYDSGKQPGMSYIKTIVSNDRLQEAEKAIAHTIDTALYSVTDDEFIQAKHALMNSLPSHFSTYQKAAETFLFLERYDLPFNYFDNRLKVLKTIEKETMNSVVSKYMDSNNFIRIKIGRV